MHPSFLAIQRKLDEARLLGSRTLANGAQLIGHVPHVAPQAYLHTIYAPLDEPEISSIEQQLGRKLPEDFRDFLRTTNGLKVFSDSLSIDGLRKNYIRTGDEAIQPYCITTPNIYERPANAPSQCIFIGGHSHNGHLIYIDALTNKVHRCRRTSSKSLESWPDFWTMLTAEVDRISIKMVAESQNRHSHAL